MLVITALKILEVMRAVAAAINLEFNVSSDIRRVRPAATANS